eukprot:GHVU01111222.1.p5 GENE.GHVU01111222.1~~GHVU01111222.1.p5  ORF type:complete len:102 (+),score=6.28 GHVU01111222.1:3312-3617(+)
MVSCRYAREGANVSMAHGQYKPSEGCKQPGGRASRPRSGCFPQKAARKDDATGHIISSVTRENTREAGAAADTGPLTDGYHSECAFKTLIAFEHFILLQGE